MLAKAIFDKCTDYSWAQFKANFRLITHSNIDYVARTYGYNNAKEMNDELQVDIVGMYSALAADQLYGEVSRFPTNDPLRTMAEATVTLRYTPENIYDNSLYENIQIFWFCGTPPRVFPHTILEYMEPEGEGDIQFTQEDYDKIFNTPYKLEELINFPIPTSA